MSEIITMQTIHGEKFVITWDVPDDNQRIRLELERIIHRQQQEIEHYKQVLRMISFQTAGY